MCVESKLFFFILKVQSKSHHPHGQRTSSLGADGKLLLQPLTLCLPLEVEHSG